jgi:hypothetical protein
MTIIDEELLKAAVKDTWEWLTIEQNHKPEEIKLIIVGLYNKIYSEVE